MFNDHKQASLDKARNVRLDSVLRALKNAMQSIESQQQKGFPISGCEHDLYAAMAFALEVMEGADQDTFEKMAHILHEAIDEVTGRSQMAKIASNLDKYQELAVEICKSFIDQGMPKEEAVHVTAMIMSKMVEDGVNPDKVKGIKMLAIEKDSEPSGFDLGELIKQKMQSKTDRSNPFLF
jgi:ERCC4-type nuclease